MPLLKPGMDAEGRRSVFAGPKGGRATALFAESDCPNLKSWLCLFARAPRDENRSTEEAKASDFALMKGESGGVLRTEQRRSSDGDT